MGAFQAGLILLRMEDYPNANELAGVDVLVLATLLSFAADDDPPQAFASAPRIAARSRLARRTVQRALQHLEDVGVIAGEHRHRRPTRWSLDPYFTKAGGGVAKSPASVREAPVKRQRDAQQASQRRSAGVREARQGTEVGSGAKAEEPYGRKAGGSASGKPARSARRAPSAPPPPPTPAKDRRAIKGSRATKTAKPGPAKPLPAPPASPPKVDPPPRCRHGVVGGDQSGPWGRFGCPRCEAMAPRPGTPEFDAWTEPVRGFLVSNDVACADPGNEKYADRLARAKFHAHTKTQPYHVITNVPLWRTVKAYAVDQVEPGRLRQLMAANGHQPKPLGLGRFPGRCPECEAHIETQGHLRTCTRRTGA